MRYSGALLVACLLLAACQTTSPPGPAVEYDPETIENVITVTTKLCAAEMRANKEELDSLDVLGMSPEEFCECSYREFFGAMDSQETARFMDAAIERGRDIAKREPWKGKIFKAMVACMARSKGTLASFPP